jgi:CubicO group peptidase (beta-lactamase class C family)
LPRLSFNYPGAGLVSTAEDLVTFGTELLRGSYFNRQLVPQLFTSQKTTDGTPTHYGLGWNIIKDSNGRTVWFHAGRLLDGSGYLVIYPDEELVFAFLSNSPAGAEFDIQKLASIYYQK